MDGRLFTLTKRGFCEYCGLKKNVLVNFVLIRVRSVLSAVNMKGYKKKLGQWGEELALKFFEEKDHILIEKNWRANLQKNVGEIDLIFTKNKDLVFVEVKTRTTNAFGYGEQAVNYSKKQKISKTINHFRTSNEKYDDFFPRFDILVIEIFDLTPKYIHYENVEL